jgi:hypothetical protein
MPLLRVLHHERDRAADKGTMPQQYPCLPWQQEVTHTDPHISLANTVTLKFEYQNEMSVGGGGGGVTQQRT